MRGSDARSRACRARPARRRRGRGDAASVSGARRNLQRQLRDAYAGGRRCSESCRCHRRAGGGARPDEQLAFDEAGRGRRAASSNSRSARARSRAPSVGHRRSRSRCAARWSRSARSPKKPPGPSVGHLLAVAARPGPRPSRITKNSAPAAPSVTITCARRRRGRPRPPSPPAGAPSWTGRRRAAPSARWSTNGSGRAMAENAATRGLRAPTAHVTRGTAGIARTPSKLIPSHSRFWLRFATTRR